MGLFLQPPVTIGIQLRETVENRKKHIMAMKAIESVGKLEFDHHVISRHSNIETGEPNG